MSGRSDFRGVSSSDLLVPGSMENSSGSSVEGGGGNHSEPQGRPAQTWADVPWRTIIASIGLVMGSCLTLVVIYLASRVFVWVVVSGFFALVLARPVGFVQHKFHARRSVGVAVVVLVATLVLVGLMTMFVFPLRRQLLATLTDLPGTVRLAASGEGALGKLLVRLGLQDLVRQNQTALIRGAESIEGSAPAYLGSVVQSVLAVVTVAVTTCLMLMQSSLLSRAVLRLTPMRHRSLASGVGRDAASAVNGYMSGNLLISGCAGAAAFVLLAVLGVPNLLVLALWVAFADLIPLVGATLGAIAPVIAAFFVSLPAGIIALVFFLVYQQFENSVLQAVIMSRTVHVNSLVVLLSVLMGVELFGFIGALLAVPMAGALSVIFKEMWIHRPSAPDELLVVRTRKPRTEIAAGVSRWRKFFRRH